jgi:protein involved in sex pheromone biosynthesis
MPQDFRCNCPFTSALDILGDKWMLVIVKQMLVEGKETFKDFTESEEAIATNILSTKLKLLEEVGIIIKTPILVELASWSDSYLRGLNPSIVDGEAMESMRRDKAAFASALEQNYRAKLASMVYE